MMTLQEVKRLVEVPGKGVCVPSAKQLKSRGNMLLYRRMDGGAKLSVYREGYAVYEVGNHATVFSIAACSDYDYGESGGVSHISGAYFDGLAWYLRLIIEGEDR